MPSTPAPAHVVPLKSIEAAYKSAIELCQARFAPGIQRDVAVDRATDAVMRAAQTYDPAICPTFEGYAGSCVKIALREVYSLPKQSAATLNEDHGALAPANAPPDWSALPVPLRAAVVFHITYGFTLAETGLLCGISREGAAKRIRAAARLIDEP